MPATSAISRRWRNIWARTSTLNFIPKDHFYDDEEPEDPAQHDEDIRKYVNWVNSVLARHVGGDVELFRVFFDTENPWYVSSTLIWLQFAQERRVRRFELTLLHNSFIAGEMKLSYASRSVGSDERPLLEHLCRALARVLHPCRYKCTSFKFLKSVYLGYVQVMGEGVQCLLSNCPCLEDLSLYSCNNLGNLRIIGPSIALKLKFLTICHCHYLKRIIICDLQKLESFTYEGANVSLDLENLSQLTELSIHTEKSSWVTFSFLSKLRVLKLSQPMMCVKKDHKYLQLEILDHLELRFAKDDACCLLQLASFIKASPLLQKLVLKLDPHFATRKIELKQADKCSHDSLRVVEVKGYLGRTSDLKLLMYLIENAVHLKQIVIHPIQDRWLSEDEQVARKEAITGAKNQLQENVPPKIQLVCHL